MATRRLSPEPCTVPCTTRFTPSSFATRESEAFGSTLAVAAEEVKRTSFNWKSLAEMASTNPSATYLRDDSSPTTLNGRTATNFACDFDAGPSFPVSGVSAWGARITQCLVFGMAKNKPARARAPAAAAYHQRFRTTGRLICTDRPVDEGVRYIEVTDISGERPASMSATISRAL